MYYVYIQVGIDHLPELPVVMVGSDCMAWLALLTFGDWISVDCPSWPLSGKGTYTLCQLKH
jgi:hypothetical protein